MLKEKLKDFFIPQSGNNYAPHGLQKAAMLGMLFLVVLSFTATNALSLIWISSEWMVSTVLPAVIVDLTNAERKDDAIGTLRRNAVLDDAARRKAEHMAKNQYFAHYSPDGVSPWYWFGEVAYNFVHAGENLAIHFTDSGEVVDAWMGSPSHKENILNGNYTEIGVGTAEGMYEGFQTVYVVQLFGTPAATVASVQNTEEPETLALGESENASNEAQEAVLAESVSVVEEIVMIPSEPIAMVVEEEVIPESQLAAASETEQQSNVTVQNTVVENMDSEIGGVIMYSDFISTSTGGVPATLAPTDAQKSKEASLALELVTQPHTILQILYILIGLSVLISLTTSIFIEIRHQQPVQIAYGVGLLALMLCLFYIHTALSSGASIV